MYHIPNQPLYHHNAYQECSLYCELKTHVSTAAEHNHFTTQHSVQANFTKPCESQAPSTPVKNSKKTVQSSNVDTSNFSIEERLVAAVWVHERKRTKSSINQIKNEFKQRFGRDPPAKNTLLVWERKLFSTGSVHDAPRSGRPINRRSHMDEVEASVRSAPALSLRARASALHVPHTTLHTILQKDLPNLALKRKESSHSKVQNKQQSTRRIKKQMKKTKSKIFEQTQCTGNLPMSATDDLDIATHYIPPHTLNTNGYTT